MISQQKIRTGFTVVGGLLFSFILSTELISEPFKLIYKQYKSDRNIHIRFLLDIKQNKARDLLIKINDVNVDSFSGNDQGRVRELVEDIRTLNVKIERSNKFHVKRIVFKDTNKDERYINSNLSDFSDHSSRSIQTFSHVLRMVVFGRPKNPENNQRWIYKIRKKEDVSANHKYPYDFYRFKGVEAGMMYKGIYKFSNINNDTDSVDYSVQSLRGIDNEINLFASQLFRSYRGSSNKEKETKRNVHSFKMKLHRTNQ